MKLKLITVPEYKFMENDNMILFVKNVKLYVEEDSPDNVNPEAHKCILSEEELDRLMTIKRTIFKSFKG